jgi:putative transposase
VLFPALREALGAANRADFRVIHFSIQQDHLHLIVEADGHDAFRSGMQGLASRCAWAVKLALGRRGRVWDHRYHAHPLGTPREVRAALVYVLLNFRKHLRARPGIDGCSSGLWFTGWSQPATEPAGARPVCHPRTWLAAIGWRRGGGPIDIAESPALLRSSRR